MPPSLRRAVLALVLLAGCAVEPVDFTGKQCSGPGDCPDGLTCDPALRKCVLTSAAGADAAGPAGLDAATLPPDSGEPWDLDADVEPPDARAPGRDASLRADVGLEDAGPAGPDAAAPGLDASGPGLDAAAPGRDAASPGLDAAASGPDAAAPGPDASAPGPDASAPGPDAGACGTAVGAPLLQRVGPAAVMANSVDGVQLSLGGANFDPCAQVLVGGQLVPSTWSGPTALSAAVPPAMVVAPGVLPVQVVNPGSTGGTSNANTDLISSKTLAGNPEPIGAAVLDTGALAVAMNSTRLVEFFDGETLATASPAVTMVSAPVGLAYGGGKLWVPYSSTTLAIISDPLGVPVKSSVTLAQSFLDLDVDEDFGTLLVAEQTSRYQTVDLVTQAVSAAQQIGSGSPGMGLQAAALDGLRDLAVLPFSGGTYVVPLGTATPSFTSATGSYGVAIDRAGAVAYQGGNSTIKRLALAPPADLGSVAMALPIRMLRHNPLSRRLVGAPSGDTTGAYSVAIFDSETGTMGGYLGAGAQRGCGPSLGWTGVRPEGLAIDPLHNRAYVTATCADTIEAYNLNVLLVVLPAPTITSLSPASRTAGGTGTFPLKVLGTNFHATARVTWGATVLTPVPPVTPTELNVNAPLQACGGTKTLTVANTDPARWSASKTFSFTMGTPTVSSASLDTACTCTDGACTTCTVTVAGSGFTSGCSVIHVGSSSGAGTGSATSLSDTVSLCAGAVGSGTECGLQSLGVYVSNPGGGSSGTVQITY